MSRLLTMVLVALASVAALVAAYAETGYQPPAGHTWEELNKEYWDHLTAHTTENLSLCKSGLLQSPIDMPNATSGTLPGLTFNYPGTGGSYAVAYNTGHSYQLYLDPDDYKTPRKTPTSCGGAALSAVQGVTVNNVAADGTTNPVTYKLLQYHFHHPSEHLLNGERFPLEMHLVHQDPQGNKLVIAIFLKPAAEGEASNGSYGNWYHANEWVKPGGCMLDGTGGLLPPPEQRAYRRYAGSLTTPPCSEGGDLDRLHHTCQSAPNRLRRHQEPRSESALHCATVSNSAPPRGICPVGRHARLDSGDRLQER